MTNKYLTFVSRIREELCEIDKLILRTLKAWDNVKKTSDELYLDSVALNLHGIYSGFEKIFEIIAKNIDSSMPFGDSWHLELLKQMATEIQQVRPPVIKKQTFEFLNEYRGFRHIVRNVYTYNISTKKLTPLVEDLQTTYDFMKKDLEEFLKLFEVSLLE